MAFAQYITKNAVKMWRRQAVRSVKNFIFMRFRSETSEQNRTEFIVLPENKHKIDVNTELFMPGNIEKL